MNPVIREESLSDIAAIRALISEAFLHFERAWHTEQFIVDALRAAGALSLSLIAEIDGTVVGHAALSPVSISDGTEGWYGLGPVSVLPEFQGHGIGSELVRASLKRLQARGAAGCVVLGRPGFYSRFGFNPLPGLFLPGMPPEYFQAIAFGSILPSGFVSYHQAFDAKS